MNIPLVDLKRQHGFIRDEISREIEKVVESGRFILGENVEAFEEEFAGYCGVKYGVGVASGSDALALSLKSLGVGRGDEVITVPNTFIATADAISRNGGRLVFVDVDPETYTMDVSKVEKNITQKTKSIIPVHLYGHPADMRPIKEMSEKYGLSVVEDACQAHGAEYKGEKVGSLGDVACFSFYPSKNLGACGDGGMVVTDDEELASRVKIIRNYGQKEKYFHDFIGYNSRLDEVQAAILRVKLNHLDRWNERRRENAKIYNELLPSTVETPVESKSVRHVYHLYVIKSENRGRLQKMLALRGISTGIHYPVPVHLQKAYSHLGHKKGDFAAAEVCADSILSLPMFPELTEAEIEFVSDSVTLAHRTSF